MSRKKNKEPSVFALLDESFSLLRQLGLTGWAWYVVGTFPFVGYIMYFWADVSRNAFAETRLTFQAFLLTLLFIWMKYGHVQFVASLKATLFRMEKPTYGWRKKIKIALEQGFLQSTGFYMIPLSMILMVPFGWVYAYYQGVSYHAVTADEKEAGVRNLHQRASETAKIWPIQNHYLIYLISPILLILLAVMILVIMPMISMYSGIYSGFFLLFTFVLGLLCSPLCFIIAVNYFALLVFVPELCRILFGIETPFTMNSLGVLNSYGFVLILGLSYLTVDPLVKTAYTLRCFYAEARKTGEDIRLTFNHAPLLKRGLVLLFFLGNLLAPAFQSHANVPPEEDPHELLAATIELELQKPEYAWRFPKLLKEKEDQEKGFLERKVEAFNKWVSEKVGNLFEKIGEWLDFFDVKPKDQSRNQDSIFNFQEIVKYLVLILCVILVVSLLYWSIVAYRRQPTKKTEDVATGPITAEDVAREDIRADALPHEEWLALAHELAEKGDFRLAIRACFLAVLAQLNTTKKVTIAPYKSNREYRRELALRTRGDSDTRQWFIWTVTQFEKVWYGDASAGKEEYQTFLDQTMKGHQR